MLEAMREAARKLNYPVKLTVCQDGCGLLETAGKPRLSFPGNLTEYGVNELIAKMGAPTIAEDIATLRGQLSLCSAHKHDSALDALARIEAALKK